MGILDDYYGIKTNKDGFVSSVKRGSASMVGGVGEIYAKVTGDEEYDNALTRFDERVQAENPSEINSLQDVADNPWLATKVAAGSAVPFLASGLAGRGIGLAGRALGATRVARAGEALNSFAAQTAIAGLPTYRQVGGAQRASGEEPHDLLQAAAALAVGGIETRFGIQGMLGVGRGIERAGLRAAVGEFAGSPLRTAGKVMGRAAVGEGGEELAQNPIEQYASYQDPTTPQSLEQTALGGVMGALGGAAFGLFGGARAGLQHRALRSDLQSQGYLEPGASTPTDLLRGLETRDYQRYLEPRQDEANQYQQYREDPLGAVPGAVIVSAEDLDNVPGRVNQNLGVRDITPAQHKARQQVLNAVFSEGSGVWVNDPETQQERQLTGEEWAQIQHAPASITETATYDPSTGELPPIQTVGDAVGVIQAAHEDQLRGRPVVEGTPLHARLFQAQAMLSGAGLRYAPPAAKAERQEKLNSEAKKSLKLLTSLVEDGTLTANDESTLLAKWETSLKTVGDALMLRQAIVNVVTGKTAPATALQGAPNGNASQVIRPGSDQVPASQTSPNFPGAGVLAQAAQGQVAQGGSGQVQVVPQTPPPPKPKDEAGLPAYRAAMQPWLTSTLSPEEIAAVAAVHGANKDAGEDAEVAAKSLRAAAKTQGVSHETIRQRALSADAKIAAAAQVAEIPLDAAHEILGMQSSMDVMSQEPVSLSQAAEAGLRVQHGARGETAVADAGSELGGEADLVGEFGGSAEFDEGYAQEPGAERLDTAVEMEDAELAPTARDYQGYAIRPVDFEDAALEWKTNVDGQDIPKQLLTQFTKLWIANEDGVLNDRTFYEKVRALRQQASELRRIPEVAASVESGAQGEDTGPAEVQRQPAEVQAERPPERDSGEEGIEEGGEDVTPEELWATAWDEQVAGPVGVAPWKNLTESQKAHLMSTGADEDAQGAAIEAVVRELRGDSGGAKFSQGKAAGQKAEALRATLKRYFFSGERFDRKVTVVQAYNDLPMGVRAEEGLRSGTKAFVLNNHAYLIADNIAPDEGLAVFLHEVGAHLGMKNLLGAENYAKLLAQVKAWEKQQGTQEAALAQRARARVESAQTAEVDRDEELMAYFIEEAVTAGINPAALHKVQGPMQAWFRTLWAAVKAAVRKFGLDYVEKLDAQDVVNLAYGAARLELEGTWHGAKRDKLRFSQPLTTLPEMTAFTDSTVAEMIRRVKVTAADLTKKAINSVVFMHDLIAIGVKAGLTTAKGFNELMGEKDQIRNRMEERVDQIMQKASQLEDQPLVEKFLRDSTIEGKWGYGNKADPVFASRFKSLSPEGQAVVKEIFAVGEADYAEMQRLTALEINTEYDELITRYPQNTHRYNKERAADLRRLARAMPKMEGPYAPLKRFGDHVVVAKSKDYLAAEKVGDDKTMQRLIDDKTNAHYVVEFYDTAGAADFRREQLTPLFQSVIASNRQENFKRVDELPWSGIAKIKTAIEDSPDRKYKEAMEGLVTRLYLQMLAEASARKAELRRQGVLGSGDMFRAFAAHGRSTAHYLASMTKSKEISRQITAMRNEAHEAPGDVRDGATRVFNEIMARYNQGLEYKETPWADKMLRTSSLWMLLTSPAYYITNATQTYMVALPVLGGRYGARAFTEISKAYGDVAKYVGKMGHELDIAKLPISDAERKMLVSLRDKGKLDITITSDLGRWASGAADQGVVGRVVGKLHKAVGQVEALNRITTALAAYRLSGTEAYAGEMVDLTQGNYAGNNAPRFFHASGFSKLITQFRKYQLIQISLIGRLVHDSFAGSSKEEKAVARRALVWLFAQQAVFTGIKGLPIPAVLYMAAAALGGDDDKDWERNLRKGIGDEGMATLLIRGVPAWMGLDLSGRIGMGNAFSVLPFSNVDFSKKGYKEAVFGASGAFVGGMGGQLADGVDKMAKGHFYKGTEALMPRGLRDAMAGYRMAAEGVTTGRGDTVLSPDEISVFSGLMKAVGLPTTTITEFQTSRNDLYELGAHFKERDTAVKDAYARAAKERDGEDMSAAREEWVALQAAKTRWREEMARRGFGDKKLLEGIKAQPLSTLLKAPQALAKREKPWENRLNH